MKGKRTNKKRHGYNRKMKRANMPRSRYCRKYRVVALLLAVMAILVFLCMTLMPSKVETDKLYTTYTVKSGDTLWGICRELYGDSCDIRYKIADIQEINGITGGRIYSGMRLAVEVSECETK